MREKNAQVRIQRSIAVSFFVFWLMILYAGADHPPPPGFLLLILIDLGCAIVVGYRSGTYIEWIRSGKKNRIWRALGDGLLAGFVIAGVVMIFPGGGEPSAPSPGLVDKLIWFVIVGFMGAVNSLGVFGLLALIMKKIHPKVETDDPSLDG